MGGWTKVSDGHWVSNDGDSWTKTGDGHWVSNDGSSWTKTSEDHWESSGDNDDFLPFDDGEGDDE